MGELGSTCAAVKHVPPSPPPPTTVIIITIITNSGCKTNYFDVAWTHTEHVTTLVHTRIIIYHSWSFGAVRERRKTQSIGEGSVGNIPAQIGNTRCSYCEQLQNGFPSLHSWSLHVACRTPARLLHIPVGLPVWICLRRANTKTDIWEQPRDRNKMWDHIESLKPYR